MLNILHAHLNIFTDCNDLGDLYGLKYTFDNFKLFDPLDIFSNRYTLTHWINFRTVRYTYVAQSTNLWFRIDTFSVDAWPQPQVSPRR